MEENNYRFGVGLLVVAAAVIGIMLVLFFGTMPTFLTDRYQVTINFPSAPRVGRDTPVRKNGVQIGRVSSVKLLKGSEGVNLVLELDREYTLAQGETCRISTGSLVTGDAIVEFIQPTESQLIARFDGVGGGVKNGQLDLPEREFAANAMADGDYLYGGVVAGDPLDMLVNMQGNFASTLTAIEQASRRVESLAGTVEGVLGGGDNQLTDVADRIRFTIDNFNETIDTIDRVARQFENSKLPDVMGVAATRMPILFDEAERVLKQTQLTLKGYEQFSSDLQNISQDFQGIGQEAKSTVRNANEAMENIREITEPLSEQSQELVTSAVRSLGSLDQTLAEIRVFAQKLNNGDGTLARLIEDDQMYYSLVQTLDNVQRVSNRLEPIVNDVRVITDKLSRDPSQLGVRGVLKSSPLGAGLK